jgi:hypothetical protein
MAAELRAAALAALTVRKLAGGRRGKEGGGGDDAADPPASAAAGPSGADRRGSGPTDATLAAAPAAAVAADAAAAVTPESSSPLATALRLLIGQTHTAVTTRPAFATAIGCSSYVRLEPLARADVVDFASRALGGVGSKAWGRLQARMASSVPLADALRTPVIMQVSREP